MAYSKLLVTKCGEEYCNKPATHEVFGKRNQSYGKYCKGCSAARVREIAKEESA